MYGWTDEYCYELPFLRFWTCYKLAQFENEKALNESRFAPAWVTYFLKSMFPSDETKMSFESWAEGLGVSHFGKKKKGNSPPPMSKAEEIKKSQANLDYIFGFQGGLEKQNLKSDFGKITKLQKM